MKNKAVLSLGVLLLFILSGCTSTRLAPEVLERTPTSIPPTTTYTAALPSTETTVPTATLPAPPPVKTYVPGPTPTSTPVLPQTTGDIPVCQGEGQVSELVQTFTLPGKLLHYTADYQQDAAVMGGSPLQAELLALGQSERHEVLGFSPDGKWLAYYPIDPAAFVSPHPYNMTSLSLTLLSNSGEQVVHNLDLSGFGKEMAGGTGIEAVELVDWRANDRMHVRLVGTSGEVVPYTGSFRYLYKVLDPFTGTWLPEWTRGVSEGAIHNLTFSPQMDLALMYASPGGLALWDILRGQVLWEDISYQGHSTLLFLEWSPNGSMALIAEDDARWNHPYIILLSREGEILKQIVNRQYPARGLSASIIAWSPDSRFIAIAARYNTTVGPVELLVYDVQQDAYLYRCPLGTSVSEMAWSPDSRYMALSDWMSPLLLLEVQTGRLMQLDSDGIVLGWSEDW